MSADIDLAQVQSDVDREVVVSTCTWHKVLALALKLSAASLLPVAIAQDEREAFEAWMDIPNKAGRSMEDSFKAGAQWQARASLPLQPVAVPGLRESIIAITAKWKSGTYTELQAVQTIDLALLEHQEHVAKVKK